ncbi:dethiobiotin synthase [Crocosphaera subtropica ATCC 51142]|uniref:ATP-dependent dethiobiotin synthetase BioD n=1 Tax=Crocosphaera subtropica (strain ATCC 51142 / BH68) TaxID=43989 RepID=BIOD_CROS5|nr:dethiobiotin synthase [Crocosphaera subtropica]B1WZW5.1 RecName: Full=ATP-dependent dethiobiotin synthetase BioD; AltName: Full=DTB synthetase; Short=DTBS; AltName: Full=Dethiobiotin synthase [Crocosphaera subtropica ATCC 51142]ACB52864.1 dethiobiotin synthase [Crocosphaera subtropica ATCC 51142]
MTTLFIVGTDTEVGKTVVTSALAAYWQTYHSSESLGVIKLLQTGIGDVEHYQRLLPHVEVVNPLRYETPVAPPVAAEKENRSIPLDQVWQGLNDLQQRKNLVLAEGLGGLGSPVTWELTVADLAGEWGLPTVLVVPVKLGAIAQTVANVALARQYKVNLKGIIFSCPRPLSHEEIVNFAPITLIESLTKTPVLGMISYLENIEDITKLAHIASSLDLEMLF